MGGCDRAEVRLVVRVVELSDAQVLAQVRGGDVEAYAVLVDRYYPRCLRFALRRLNDGDDAEDAVQQTLIKAYGALDGYREDGRFGAWLFRILLNECRTTEVRRARQRDRTIPLDELPEVGRRDHPPNLVGREIRQALAELSPLLREAFLLRHVEGFTYDEMKMQTGEGVSALKMRVKRAADLLRERLKEVAL